MKLIGQILAWLFIIGLVVIVGRFVLAVIGVGGGDSVAVLAVVARRRSGVAGRGQSTAVDVR